MWVDVSVWIISTPIRDAAFYLNAHYSKEGIFYAFYYHGLLSCTHWWTAGKWIQLLETTIGEEVLSLTSRKVRYSKLKLFQEKDNPGACLTGFGKGPWTPRSGGQAAQLENIIWK